MKYLWIAMMLIGVWFLASASTENGLLPSGHGSGRFGEAIEGVVLIAYSAFRLRKSS